MPTKKDIAVVVLAGRPVTPALMDWLGTFPPENVRPCYPFGSLGGAEMLAVWRNSIVCDFLDNRSLPYLMMVDADAWPTSESDGIVHAHGDICGVHAVGRHGHRAHAGDGEVGAHCIRISRRALEAIAACDAFDPDRGWFAFPTINRGTGIANCEDGYFCRLARQAGFHPIKVAPMGHLVPVVVSPGDGPDAVNFHFPAQLMQATASAPQSGESDAGERPCRPAIPAPTQPSQAP